MKKIKKNGKKARHTFLYIGPLFPKTGTGGPACCRGPESPPGASSRSWLRPRQQVRLPRPGKGRAGAGSEAGPEGGQRSGPRSSSSNYDLLYFNFNFNFNFNSYLNFNFNFNFHFNLISISIFILVFLISILVLFKF